MPISSVSKKTAAMGKRAAFNNFYTWHVKPKQAVSVKFTVL